MPLGVSYMGTKRQLAEAVAGIVDESKPGPMLDLFAGMCSVGTAVRGGRQVWSNDLQYFAWNVATAFFCSETLPPTQIESISAAYPIYLSHVEKLLGDWEDANSTRDYNLFVSTFSETYFGRRQCAEIDSIRKAIDSTAKHGTDHHRWLVLALCRAVSRCATTTGHFAQPLARKEKNSKRFDFQRQRSVWREWTSALDQLRPVGSADWRKRNIAYRCSAVDLLADLKREVQKPSVIYADPPYTSDQYSRYYHLYETIILYDYPESVGKGQYRKDRAVSKFSLKGQIGEAINSLVENSAELDSELILSYPTNGLLKDSRDKIPEMIRRHYGRAPRILETAHTHSTMGGSKGPAAEAVVEVIYHARP